MIRSHRYPELKEAISLAKEKIGIEPGSELHFRKLQPAQQVAIVGELSGFKAGLVAVVSNKRNMRRYRNRRVEAKNMETVRGRVEPQSYNWFYNHLFRYLLESASAECARWTSKAYGRAVPMRVVFSHRRHFRYSQTRAYLHKLRVERHGPDYFNNKRQINWSVVDPNGIASSRSTTEPGLQFADVVASAIFKAIDEDWFGTVSPIMIETLAPRFIRLGATPKGYGFKLLPDGFSGPVSPAQGRTLRAVGYWPLGLS